MGASTFITEAFGKTAHEAFESAKRDAIAEWEADWEEEYDGYSGSIAEKSSFVMVNETPESLVRRVERRLAGKDNPEWLVRDLNDLLATLKKRRKVNACQIARTLIAVDDSRITDKWGPCACIDLTPKRKGVKKPKHFLFFGWASS